MVVVVVECEARRPHLPGEDAEESSENGGVDVEGGSGIGIAVGGLRRGLLNDDDFLLDNGFFLDDWLLDGGGSEHEGGVGGTETGVGGTHGSFLGSRGGGAGESEVARGALVSQSGDGGEDFVEGVHLETAATGGHSGDNTELGVVTSGLGQSGHASGVEGGDAGAGEDSHADGHFINFSGGFFGGFFTLQNADEGLKTAVFQTTDQTGGATGASEASHVAHGPGSEDGVAEESGNVDITFDRGHGAETEGKVLDGGLLAGGIITGGLGGGEADQRKGENGLHGVKRLERTEIGKESR